MRGGRHERRQRRSAFAVRPEAARAPVFAALTAPAAAFAEYGMNLPTPVTPIGQRILDLHNLVLWICAVIFLLVFGAIFYSIVAYRRRPGVEPATFHDNVQLEALWTIVPFLILVGMAIPSTATLIDMTDVRGSKMTVHVIGYQWRWQYEYPEHEIGYLSTLATPREQIANLAAKNENYLIEVDNPLVLPTGVKVRLILTSSDVIHAWWVPELGIKADAVPGFIREVWTRIDEPGTYRGVCAEFCGRDHAFMPIAVQAVTPGDFERWIAGRKQQAAAAATEAEKTWSREDLMERGKQVYQQVCAACHGPDGKGVPGAFPPIAGSAIAKGPVSEHVGSVLKGRNTGRFPAPMPPFGQQLSDVDVAAVVTLERNGFGNDRGDVVQPAQVKSAR